MPSDSIYFAPRVIIEDPYFYYAIYIWTLEIRDILFKWISVKPMLGLLRIVKLERRSVSLANVAQPDPGGLQRPQNPRITLPA